MAKIFVIGSSNTDMVIKSRKLPRPGETVLGGEFFMNPGGKGANQAVAAARLGGEVALVANVGSDVFGEQALAHFREQGIDCSFVRKDPVYSSGIAMISVDEQAENHIVVAPGANAHLAKDHVDAAFRQMSGEAILLLQLEVPIETVAHAIERGREKSMRIILNPAPADTLPASMLSGLYLLTPNEGEASLLSGVEVTDTASAEKAGGKLLHMGVENVVITLGSKGALWLTRDGAAHFNAPTVKAVDTTAAGDCFNGALAAALAEGKDLAKGIEFACRAASFSVTRMGAQASMPFLLDLSLFS